MEVIPPPGVGRFLFLSAMYALLGETEQRYIACHDIGRAVAAVFSDPNVYQGSQITLAGQIANVNDLITSLEEGERRKGWGKIWLPRSLVIALTPRDYQQMFNVSIRASPEILLD